MLLEPDFQPGATRCGVWSALNGDAQRQQRSAAIQWGEFFCPTAAAVEFAGRLANSHVVFVIDNSSDVAIINRQRTRDPRVAGLLRLVCDVALRHNFTFTAVHRSGESNVLMDWASRPSLHKFAPRPSPPLQLPQQQGFSATLGGGGLCSSPLLFPPFLSPTRITLLNNRCLDFQSGNSVTWATLTGAW